MGIGTGLTPEQLRAAAQKLRERWSPPAVSMNPAEYVSHEAMHGLAWALDEVAADEEGR